MAAEQNDAEALALENTDLTAQEWGMLAFLAARASLHMHRELTEPDEDPVMTPDQAATALSRIIAACAEVMRVAKLGEAREVLLTHVRQRDSKGRTE